MFLTYMSRDQQFICLNVQVLFMDGVRLSEGCFYLEDLCICDSDKHPHPFPGGNQLVSGFAKATFLWWWCWWLACSLGGGMPSERSFCVSLSVCLSMCLSVCLSARHVRDGVIPFLFSCRGKEVLPVWPVLLFLYWERQQQVGRMKLFNGMQWWRLTWSGLKLVKEINNIFNFINRKLITITFSEVVGWLEKCSGKTWLRCDFRKQERAEIKVTLWSSWTPENVLHELKSSHTLRRIFFGC